MAKNKYLSNTQNTSIL